jgi:asparagine synthase (glutamine-hydrolysing)
VRRAVLVARDMPMGLGDMDTSLYLLCKAIRERSTVALSGESADEIFGGYSWFHDPAVQRAHAFPWHAAGTRQFAETNSMLHEDVRAELDLVEYRCERYERAIAEVDHLESESDLEYRMRISSYLHLTRFLPLLLDRKDRMSMAVGLEVRVPFCDHRLVDYVFNIPWRLKTFDGREKSILRAATRELLPDSIVERQKSPYPSTQDPAYEKALRANVAEVLEERSHPATPLLNRKVIEDMLARPVGNVSSLPDRSGLERALSISTWVKDYAVALDL